ncbi:MAG: hypothetical protein JWP61_1003 [Friedmanniella sp.]|nr:hypothetical protein [Friedmanniella sp.]
MLSIQVGSALSVGLASDLGAGGAAWLRLSAGALILLLVARPPWRTVRRRDAPGLLALGITTGLVTVCFLAAIARIPLGTAVSVEFLGPLSVAAVKSPHRRALAWPALALIGVLLLAQPWRGRVDPAGLGFAALAAVGWAGYILLTQHVGTRFSGIGGLGLTVPVAAVTAAAFGVPQAAGHLTPTLLVIALGLAVLHPVLPFAFEMLALRRMSTAAFGTLMAVEPAIGVLVGTVLLHQRPSAGQVAGLALVVLAGAGAQRVAGGRDGSSDPDRIPRSSHDL